jgi:excisionase family DNA binding protein
MSTDGGTGSDTSAPVFISVAEAGRLLGVGRCRAYELVRDGHLPAVRMGRSWRVPRRALDVLADTAITRCLGAEVPR